MACALSQNWPNTGSLHIRRTAVQVGSHRGNHHRQWHGLRDCAGHPCQSIQHLTHSHFSLQLMSKRNVKCLYCTIRESLVKVCEGNISKWPTLASHTFWADHITTRKATRHSPFYMAHSVEPILPFNIMLATFLVPNIAKLLSTSELLAVQAHQLQKCNEDLTKVHDNILKSHFESVQKFEHSHKKALCDFNFKPSALVLVCNSTIKTNLGRKSKPHYLSPMVVMRQTPNGSYCLAELDGTVSKL